MSLIQQYGSPVYNVVKTGQIQGNTSGTGVQLPDVKCTMVQFKALTANAGKVYLGTSVAMTLPSPGSASNATAGYQLSPGDFSPWICLGDLNMLWSMSDNVNDTLTYIALD